MTSYLRKLAKALESDDETIKKKLAEEIASYKDIYEENIKLKEVVTHAANSLVVATSSPWTEMS